MPAQPAGMATPGPQPQASFPSPDVAQDPSSVEALSLLPSVSSQKAPAEAGSQGLKELTQGHRIPFSDLPPTVGALLGKVF